MSAVGLVMQSQPRSEVAHHQRQEHPRNMCMIANVQERAREMATAMEKEEQNRVRDVPHLTSTIQIVRIWYAPIVGQQQRHFGAATRMATLFVMHVDSTSNCIMYTDR